MYATISGSMATKETRRGFLRGMAIAVGGVAAGTLSELGCVAPSSPAIDSVGPAGATEVLPSSPGVRFANVMPDHVAAVRRMPMASAVRTPASFTSKAFE
jgi:hypothetical protein